MKTHPEHIPPILWVLLLLALLTQSTWLFLDARKRNKYPWFWGVWGLFSFPLPILLYWLFVRSGWFRRKVGHDDR